MRHGEKEDRLVAGTTKRPVQGLTSENDCKIIIANSCRIASPSFSRKGVTLP